MLTTRRSNRNAISADKPNKHWTSKRLLQVLREGHQLNATSALDLLVARVQRIHGKKRQRLRAQVIRAIRAGLKSWEYNVDVDGGLYHALLRGFVALDFAATRRYMKKRLGELRETLEDERLLRFNEGEQAYHEGRLLAIELNELRQIEDAPTLVDASRSAHEEIRRRIAEGLGGFALGRQPYQGYDATPEKAIVTCLESLTADQVEAVRVVATLSLGAFASEGEKYARVLIELLRDPNSERVRSAAAQALRGYCQYQELVLPALVDAFTFYTSCNDDLTKTIDQTLEEYRRQDLRRQCYLAGINCDNGFIAAHCAKRLRNVWQEGDITALGEMLLRDRVYDWSDPRAQFVDTMIGCSERDSALRDKVTGYFITGLRHELEVVRQAAADGIGQLGHEEVAPTLLAAMQEDERLLPSILRDLPTSRYQL